jgi:hypothetical protein
MIRIKIEYVRDDHSGDVHNVFVRVKPFGGKGRSTEDKSRLEIGPIRTHALNDCDELEIGTAMLVLGALFP